MTPTPSTEAPADDPLLRTLNERFGVPSFRAGQREVIEALGLHRAALAVFPTGGGKSLCYQLPAIEYEGVTVVVSPLIALMKDQIDFLLDRGIRAARLDSSLDLDETRAVSASLLDGSLRILYVSPERFNNERFVEQLRRVRIALFAVDEAHCISEWGHNFRPDYLKLAEVARDLGAERVLALTATATPPVVADIRAGFGIPEAAAIVTGFHRPNLFLSTAPAPAETRDERLLERLRTRPPGSSIVYVTLQRTAERVAAMLAEAGFPCRAYHAGMKDDLRAEVQDWWKTSDRGIVVATIAFGMGIDKADVRYVYHYNLPKGLESYSQEIGRAGRDGAPATVEILGSSDDLVVLENFVYGDTPARPAIRSLLADLLGQAKQFDVSLHALSRSHDVRPLVLRTALTYLELLGVLRQGTPFYAGYRVRPAEPVDRLADRFPGEKAHFVRDVFAAARPGRIWYSLDPGEVAEELRTDRQRVIAALDYLAEKGFAEVKVSDARQRFTLHQDGADADRLVDQLIERFETREAQEIDRIAAIARLIRHSGCQTAFLLEHFGEILPRPCGHCTFCATKQPTRLPEPRAPGDPGRLVDRAELSALRQRHVDALGHPRQTARFLCGLTSPAVSRERLTGHPLFGSLVDHRFAAVLEWVGE